MSAEDDGKTEEPTGKRISEAREQGNIPKSADLSSAVVIMAAALSMWIFGASTGDKLGVIMRDCLTRISTFESFPVNFMTLFKDMLPNLLWILMPIVGTIALISIMTQLYQTGFAFSTKALEPNFGSVFGLSGLKRMFSSTAWVELFKSLLKMGFVGLVGYQAVSRHFDEYLKTADQSVQPILSLLGRVTIEIFWKCGLLLILVGAFDYWWQRRQWKQKLRMTKQEVKDEAKSSEGDPNIKGKIKRLRQEMHRNLMMHEMPKATVVITNPTFIAIALRYEQGVDTAPIVIAKGKRLIAERIRDLANENKVPLVEDKPLARSLYEVAEVGEAIPPEFFAAVAEILAYVFGLKGRPTEAASV